MSDGDSSETRSLVAAAPRLPAAPIGEDGASPFVLVLGMHRSGTSLCSHVLSALGVDMTEEIDPQPGNRKGQWERLDIVRYHDAILKLFNRGYFTPFHDLQLPTAWWADPRVRAIQREIADYLLSRMRRTAAFGFKDPRTARLLPMWHQILRDLGIRPKVVLCLRNPAHVARSLHDRDGLDLDAGEYRWLGYMIEIFRNRRNYELCTIEYEHWFDDDADNFAKLVDFLGLELHQSAADLNLTIGDIVDRELRHQRDERQEPRQPLVRSFYKLAQRAGEDAAARETIDYIVSQYIAFRQLHRPFERAFEEVAGDSARPSGASPQVLALRETEIVPAAIPAPHAPPDAFSLRPRPPVTGVPIRCLQAPLLRPETALFVTHAANGRIKPHVPYYLDNLRRRGIAVVLIVHLDGAIGHADVTLANTVDGLFVRQNQGYDFAAWAHVVQLYPAMLNTEILYFLNDSIVGPTNEAAFDQLIARLRASSADVVGLTESFEQQWHLQSFFLAFKRTALSAPALREFVNKVVVYEQKQDVISEYEVRLATALKDAGLDCQALFPASDRVNPMSHHWKDLLHAGLPFVKVETISGELRWLDIGGWPELLAAHGYPIALVEQTLEERRAVARSRPSTPIDAALSATAPPLPRGETIPVAERESAVLRATLAEREQALADAINHGKEIRARLADEIAERTRAEASLRAAEAKLATLTEQLVARETTLSETIAAAERATSELQSARAELQETRSALGLAEGGAAERDAALAHAEAALAALRGELSGRSKAFAEATTRATEALDMVDGLRQTIADQAAALARAEAVAGERSDALARAEAAAVEQLSTLMQMQAVAADQGAALARAEIAAAQRMAELEALQRELATRDAAVTEATARAADWSEAAAAAEAELRSLEDELAKRNTALDDATARTGDTLAALDALQVKLADEAAALARAEIAAAEHAAELEAARDELAQRDAALAEATARAAEWNDAAAAAEAELAGRSADLTEARMRASEASAALDTLHERLAEQASAVARAELDAAEQLAACAELDAGDAVRRQLECAVHDRDAALDAARAELNALRHDLAGRDDALAVALARGQELADSSTAAQSEIAERDAALRRTEAALADRDLVIGEVRSELVSLQEKLDAERAKLSRAERDAADWNEAAAAATAELQALQYELAARDAALGEAAGRASETLATVDAVQASLADHAERLARAEADAAERGVALAEATRRAEEAAARLAAIETERREADAHAAEAEAARVGAAALRSALATEAAGNPAAVRRVTRRMPGELTRSGNSAARRLTAEDDIVGFSQPGSG